MVVAGSITALRVKACGFRGAVMCGEIAQVLAFIAEW